MGQKGGAAMSRSTFVTALCCLVSALTAGCSHSPQITYYSFGSTVPSVTLPVKIVMPSISVETATMPEMVDRPQLVERKNMTRIEFLEFHRWAEPLKNSIPRVVADNLARILESDRVYAYPQNVGSDAAYRVYVDFQHFESEGDSVTVDALWKIRRTDGESPKSGRVRIRELTSGGGYDGAVAAYNRALTKISSDIAMALREEWLAVGTEKK
jgi:uncharacterized lipoprotein YmbA